MKNTRPLPGGSRKSPKASALNVIKTLRISQRGSRQKMSPIGEHSGGALGRQTSGNDTEGKLPSTPTAKQRGSRKKMTQPLCPEGSGLSRVRDGGAQPCAPGARQGQCARNMPLPIGKGLTAGANSHDSPTNPNGTEKRCTQRTIR